MADLEQLKELLKIQGYDGNWNYSEYMWGLYNGLELALATLEEREPVFKEKPKEFSALDKDDVKRQGLISRIHSAWNKR